MMKESEWYRRKADQYWDMAGLARQDGDIKDADLHARLAREFEEKRRKARQLEVEEGSV